MSERRITPEWGGPPEEFYALEVSRYVKSYFVRFRKGEINKETVHRELSSAIEAALQAIEASRESKVN